MPVHVTVQFSLFREEEKMVVCDFLWLFTAFALLGFCCCFSLQEHMVLCRFADQTAVQLPPERRLIGRTLLKRLESLIKSNHSNSLTHLTAKTRFPVVRY